LMKLSLSKSKINSAPTVQDREDITNVFSTEMLPWRVEHTKDPNGPLMSSHSFCLLIVVLLVG
jgi:hypothetical protein